MDRVKFYIALIVIFVSVILAGCEKDRDAIELSTENCESAIVQEETSGEIFVEVSGAVKNPGVYCVAEDARVYQLIELAGGMTKKAQKNYLNLAEKVSDGQKIQVLTKKQYRKQNSKSAQEDAAVSDNTGEGGTNLSETDKLNINTATAEQLTNLSGIGQTKAAAIVAYREEHGAFSAVEDIKNVSGIGDATFANIESEITVN
jgi:competence protein ComEA